jgi:hypothetical protein
LLIVPAKNVPEGACYIRLAIPATTEKNGGNVRLPAVRLRSLPRGWAERRAFHRFDARSDRNNANQVLMFLDGFI